MSLLRFPPATDRKGFCRSIVVVLFGSLTAAPHALARQEKPESALPSQQQQVRHVGEAAEAVALVRVEVPAPRSTDPQPPQVRTASGVVIRCDGFVLVPTPLLTRLTGSSSQKRAVLIKDARIQVSLAPPAGKADVSRSGVPGQKSPVYAAKPGRFFDPAVPFTLIKVNDQHLPCLPLLHPDSLREGQKVRVVFAAPPAPGALAPDGGNPSPVKAPSYPATLGSRMEEKSDYWTLTLAAAKSPAVPAGAVVVDAGSGQALGMVVNGSSSSSGSDEAGKEPSVGKPGDEAAGSGAQQSTLRVVSFARLHDITNVIGLHSGGAAPAAGATPGQEREGMVWVPGGPIPLRSVSQADVYDEAMDADAKSACTPGFWIDKAEVTNEEYHHFLTETGYPSLPAEWIPSDRTQMRWTKDLPVLGVRPDDAAAFAKARGKRLVTPLEWAIARQGGESWLAEYTRQLVEANFQFRQKRIEDAWLEAYQWGDYRYLEDDDLDIVDGRFSRHEKRAESMAPILNLFHFLFGYVDRNRSKGGRDYTPVLPLLEAIRLRPNDPLTPHVLARWTPYQAVTTDLYTLLPRITPDSVRGKRAELQRSGIGPALQSDTGSHNTWLERARPVWQRFAERPTTFGQESESLNKRVGQPLTVAPAGSSPHGESAYHLRHGLTNVPELLQTNRANRSLEVAGKRLLPLYHADKQPDWLGDFTKEILHRVGNFAVLMNGGNQFKADFVWNYMNRYSINVWGPRSTYIIRKNKAVPVVDEDPKNWLLPFPVPSLRPETAGHSLENTGFRCAR